MYKTELFKVLTYGACGDDMFIVQTQHKTAH